jgi:hypothetical protein
MNSSGQKHPKKRSNLGYSDMALNNHREPNLLLTYQNGAMLGESAAASLSLGPKVKVWKSGTKLYLALLIHLFMCRIVLTNYMSINDITAVSEEYA